LRRSRANAAAGGHFFLLPSSFFLFLFPPMSMRQPIWPRFLPTSFVLAIARVGPCGRMRRAPGTWGSLAGLLFQLVVFHTLTLPAAVLFCVVFGMLSVAFCAEAKFRLGAKRHREHPEYHAEQNRRRQREGVKHHELEEQPRERTPRAGRAAHASARADARDGKHERGRQKTRPDGLAHAHGRKKKKEEGRRKKEEVAARGGVSAASPQKRGKWLMMSKVCLARERGLDTSSFFLLASYFSSNTTLRYLSM